MSKHVRAKKHLGQHFLRDADIAMRIAESLDTTLCNEVLEIGPGTGALTKHLLNIPNLKTSVIEVDRESIEYLECTYPSLRIIEGDFIKWELDSVYNGKYGVIGNFPYNISSQIMFKVLENREIITTVVGMFQKEVAKRIVSPPGSKEYGILSVLLQAYYNTEYLFTVDEHVFDPPPKVKSGVIRITRNEVKQLNCNEKLFKTIIKTGFNQRRKTLRNSLKSLSKGEPFPYSDKRPEQLSVSEFIEITNAMTKHNEL